ncbi:MAG: glycoside hydrolase family 172 protein [Planctomycetota bacterium]
MLRAICLATLGLTLVAASGRAQVPPGNPLQSLEKLKDYETRRVSSSDPNWETGNRDSRPIPAGGTLVLAELEGPGRIAHLWCTILHPHPFYSRLLTLRIYWDGEDHPSVECPIGDFFAVGHGMDQPVSSLPIRVTAEGRARNCYWPMPFRKSARITVTNDSDQRCVCFYYYVDWQKHASLPDDTAYFHAMYRQEFPCVMGRNYLVADIQGSGHYVGTVQSVYHSSPGWFGEGDDFFFIDGAKDPQLRGTGTEDYFCDAWGLRRQDGPFYGTTLWEDRNAGACGTAYRFHLPDPIVFRQSLRVEFEHKGTQTFSDGTFTGFIERDDLLSSVALWYQMEPHKDWPALPPGSERLNYRDQNILLTGGKTAAGATDNGPTPALKDLPAAADGKVLLYNPGNDGSFLELTFDCSRDQIADLFGKLLCDSNGGIYRVCLDGVEIGSADLYFFRDRLVEFKWGRRKLATGPHKLRFECVGKNVASLGYCLGVDHVVARVPVYLRPENVDLRLLQKP